MHVLLIEPYYGGSHRAWAAGYAAHSRHHVTLLTLPARFWKWRMQGGSLTLAERARRLPHPPDVILASDMLDLPTFLALTRDFLAAVPAALYCHENQLTYPFPPGEKRDLTYGMRNWLSMVAADRVFFNSQFHRDDWFAALPRLLKHFPDYTHLHRVAAVREKAAVLPVGCDLRRLDRVPAERGRLPLVLWNQRWEYDKAPEVFFRALDVLAAEGLPFEVAVAGRNYRQSAPEFDAARERLGERVVHFGYADEARYAALLRRADVVVSTAIHEFFGVAVVEAIYGGCFPVLPARLVYPALLPPEYHARCLYTDFAGLVEHLRWALSNREMARAVGAALRREMERFDWTVVAPEYDAALADVVR